ncbi:TPA: DUF2786 domain-containing protein, partial [Escherichia coli]|nr:DUF2786 domain-containing protein [Escherichia coli]
VSQTFGCSAYYDWRLMPGGRYRRCVTFYGFSERPQVAAYAFDVLCRQLRDATDAYLRTQSRRLKLSTRRARAAQFRDGWVQGVRQVVMPFSVTEEESRLMRLWLEQQAMETVAPREVKACRGGDLARWQGYEAGKNASLHHGVGGTARRMVPGLMIREAS